MQVLNILESSYFSAALLFALLIILAYLIFMHLKFKRFMMGKDAKSLEERIEELFKLADRIEVENSEIKDLALQIINDDRRSLKSFASVKFNPFSQSGHGKQSFASAVLAKDGSGFILSTLSVRGETHVFWKDVENFKAGALTDEEAQALQKAKDKLKKEQSDK